MNQAILITFVLLLSVKKGLGRVTFTDPPSGSVVANFKGAINATTLTCNVTTNDGRQITSNWFLRDFRRSVGLQHVLHTAPDLFHLDGDPYINIPGATYQNRLTISNFTSELDSETLYCGTGADPEEASFSLRVYHPLKYKDGFETLKIEETNDGLTVDLGQKPEPFPEPSEFTWRKDGQKLASLSSLIMTFSNVTFNKIKRADTGRYVVTATNFALNSHSTQVGSDTGGFNLDVLYGPYITALGPEKRYALLNESLSLVCGTGLDSNPQATITWTAPDGATITENSKHHLENGAGIVRLNLTFTNRSDAGVWRCMITVKSDRRQIHGGRLGAIEKAVMIGKPIQNDIQVTVVTPPNEPRNVTVKSVGATWLFITWTSQVKAEYPVTSYEIKQNSSDTAALMLSTTNNDTFYNVTGLLPGITYELSVVAVSQVGDVIAKSQIGNNFVVKMTEVTVPSLNPCNASESVPTSETITVTWSYIHTGGLPLTNVSLSYSFTKGSRTVIKSIPVSSIDSTSVEISDIETGFKYTFNITAENSNGSSSIICGATVDALDTGNSVAIIVGIIGGILVLGIIVIILLALIIKLARAAEKKKESLSSDGKTAINEGNCEAVYDEPHFQPYYDDRAADIVLMKCPAYQKPKKRSFTDSDTYPSIEVSGNRTTSREYHVYDLK